MKNKKIRSLSAIVSAIMVSTLVFTDIPLVNPIIKAQASDMTWEYSYTGGYQVFTVPYTGKYQLETWGAQGGSGAYVGGKGGYAKGEVNLTKGESLYIFVGGQGDRTPSSGWGYATGGWNGGGGSRSYSRITGGGGGATDITLVNSPVTLDSYNRYVRTQESYNNRIIVAGGGGGSLSSYSATPGAGGGLSGFGSAYSQGILKIASVNVLIGGAGTQTAGGNAELYPSPDYDTYASKSSPGGFGTGGTYYSAHENNTASGGGGAGWYGGGVNSHGAGGGGSGYVFTEGSYKPTGYSVPVKYYLSNSQNINGLQSFLSPTGGTEVGHAGNGYARITSLNSPPVVSVSTPIPNQEVNPGTSMNVSGTINDPDNRGTMYVKYSIDNGTPINIATLSGTNVNQKFSKDISIPNDLSVGSHTLHVWGEDNEGGIGEKQTRSFSVKDIINPTLTLTKDLSEWTNQGITITAKASDNHAIKRIQLPNGNYVNSSTASYVVTENGEYTFVAEDMSGNTVTQTINVTNKDSVVPTISEAYMENLTKDGYDIVVTGVADDSSGVNRVQFPTWTVANGKDDVVPSWSTNQAITGINEGNGTWRFHVDKSAHNGEYGDYITEVHVFDNAGNSQMVKEMRAFLDNQAPIVNITPDKTGWTKDNIILNVTTSDIGSGVKQIKLPNGNWVSETSVSYTVSENGSYSFVVEDHMGNQTTKTIKVANLDKTAPSVQHSLSASGLVEGTVRVSINATDSESGVKSITLPDGTVVNGSTASFVADHNGNYEITAEDNVGNKRPYEFTVSTLTFQPVLTVTPIAEQNLMKLEWSIADKWQGYTYKINKKKSTESIYQTIANVTGEKGEKMDWNDLSSQDVDAPNKPTIKSVSVDAMNGKVKVDYAEASDNGSSYNYYLEAIGQQNGAKVTSDIKTATLTSGLIGYSIVVDNNPTTAPDKTVDTTKTSFTLDKTINSNFYVHVLAVDKEGNSSEVSHYQYVDNEKPILEVVANQTSWTNGDIILTANASDKETAVKRIQLPNGSWVDGNTATYTITQNGTYTFIAEDLVGNQTTKSITILNIDKGLPTAPSISNNQAWTKDTPVPVSITAGTDGQSGVKRVEYKLGGATVKGWTTYDGAFQLSNEGVTDIIARTIDNVGNLSLETSSYVRIDKSTPYNVGITIHLQP